jgi:hypothetical protein
LSATCISTFLRGPATVRAEAGGRWVAEITAVTLLSIVKLFAL